jgi:hypothetical protein
MTNVTLAKSYLIKATKRLKVLPVLMQEEAYSDVIREAQEIVELALKGMLREIGVDPPKWHDVSSLIVEHQGRFPARVGENLGRIEELSKWLRKEREFSFYGDIDFIPTEEYTVEDAVRARDGAVFIVACATEVIQPQ